MNVNRKYNEYLTVGFAGIMIFYILPFLVIILKSFCVTKGVGLDNYLRLLDNISFQDACKNTLLFGLRAVPLSVFIPLILALILHETGKDNSLILLGILSAMMVPIASIALTWKVWFPVEIFGQWSIVILYLWKNIGLHTALFSLALSSVQKETLEAAMLDGAGMAKRFISIILPHIKPTVCFVFLLSIIDAYKVYKEAYVLTGDYPYGECYLFQHFLNNVFRNMNMPMLSSVSVFMLVTLIIIIGGIISLGKGSWNEQKEDT